MAVPAQGLPRPRIEPFVGFCSAFITNINVNEISRSFIGASYSYAFEKSSPWIQFFLGLETGSALEPG